MHIMKDAALPLWQMLPILCIHASPVLRAASVSDHIQITARQRLPTKTEYREKGCKWQKYRTVPDTQNTAKANYCLEKRVSIKVLS